MIKSKFKRVTSLFLATLMCVTTFAGIGSTTAYAASGEKADVYMVDFPRDGDANYDGVWGHSNLTLKKSLKEFGCNLHNYNPYRDSDIPVFREEKANWF